MRTKNIPDVVKELSGNKSLILGGQVWDVFQKCSPNFISIKSTSNCLIFSVVSFLKLFYETITKCIFYSRTPVKGTVEGPFGLRMRMAGLHS